MSKWNILHKKSLEKVNNRLDEILQILLENRNLTKSDDIETFLNPSLEKLSLKDLGVKKSELEKGAGRIQKAIKDKESVVVYTDYDVDGIASGVLIWETLYKLGAKVMPYIPHRTREGYGLSKTGIDSVKGQYKADLIITADHGVSSKKQIEYAQKLGIDVIVVDHHVLPKKLPNLCALVHTTKLCAAGISWIFSKFLILKEERKESIIEKYLWEDKVLDNLDLVALATIADLVPLTGANRVFTKHGLESLNKTERIGLKALIENSSLKNGYIGEYEVGHILAPRINAMGRITHAIDALRLLCTKDKKRAQTLADLLSSTNRERQSRMGTSYLHAKKVVTSQLFIDGTGKKRPGSKIIIIADTSYHQGVIGLIAGRLVDEFKLPAIVISKGDLYSKASARSIKGLNIIEAIRKVSFLLEDFGGHPMAAGFTILTKNIRTFKEKFVEIALNDLERKNQEKIINVDLEISLSDITLDLYTNNRKLSPFGVGNDEPVFVSRNVQVFGIKTVGKDRKHLKLSLKIDPDEDVAYNKRSGFSRTIEAIGFSMGDLFYKISPGGFIDIAYTICQNNWRGSSFLQLKLMDVKIQSER